MDALSRNNSPSTNKVYNQAVQPSFEAAIPKSSFADSIDKTTLEKRKVEKNTSKECYILGACRPIITLPEDTPLLFQWFFKNSDSKIPKYLLDNLTHACEVERGRKIGILISGRRANPVQVELLKALKEKNKNFYIIDFDKLDVSEFNFKVERAKMLKKFDESPGFKEERYKELYDYVLKTHSSEFSILELMEHDRFFNYFDTARKFAMLKAGSIFNELGDSKTPCGCIYLDLDMFLKAKLGTVETVDGFSCILKDEDKLKADNSLFAVDRPCHPVLMKWLETMKIYGNIAPTPFTAYYLAIQSHYIPEQHIDDLLFCSNNFSLTPEIAFPLDNITPDQSKQKGSSWIPTMHELS